MKKAVQMSLGIILIMMGVVGLFLPILQGLLLIACGVLVIKGGSIRDVGTVIKNLKRN
ncbi:hypothetical protein HQ545_04440 [Candidatus Woesearchaeota archaeon]|nr:hypothetical protein [Candidatus Woesearchaeota archaeon]